MAAAAAAEQECQSHFCQHQPQFAFNNDAAGSGGTETYGIARHIRMPDARLESHARWLERIFGRKRDLDLILATSIRGVVGPDDQAGELLDIFTSPEIYLNRFVRVLFGVPELFEHPLV